MVYEIIKWELSGAFTVQAAIGLVHETAKQIYRLADSQYWPHLVKSWLPFIGPSEGVPKLGLAMSALTYFFLFIQGPQSLVKTRTVEIPSTTIGGIPITHKA